MPAAATFSVASASSDAASAASAAASPTSGGSGASCAARASGGAAAWTVSAHAVPPSAMSRLRRSREMKELPPSSSAASSAPSPITPPRSSSASSFSRSLRSGRPEEARPSATRRGSTAAATPEAVACGPPPRRTASSSSDENCTRGSRQRGRLGSPQRTIRNVPQRPRSRLELDRAPDAAIAATWLANPASKEATKRRARSRSTASPHFRAICCQPMRRVPPAAGRAAGRRTPSFSKLAESVRLGRLSIRVPCVPWKVVITSIEKVPRSGTATPRLSHSSEKMWSHAVCQTERERSIDAF